MLFRRMTKLFFCALLVIATTNPNYLNATEVSTRSNAVIFAYHRFGENRYPSTNITIEQFEAHLEELKTGEYTVLPLPHIIRRIKAGKGLPDRTVGISIDDAYLSVYTHAWPRLKAAGFPFTIFIATDPVDREAANFMTWTQIQEMVKDGVTLGSHTASHPHMPTESQQKITGEIKRSQKRFLDLFGLAPDIFAYPYGETSLKIQALAKKLGFLAAFGQHSGAFNSTSEMFNLPRFSINEKYAGIKRFRLAANALALPVTDITPADPFFDAATPAAIGFSLISEIKGLKRLSCFTSHNGRAQIKRLGKKRIEVRFNEPLPIGRTRLNCTLPGDKGRWHWFGRQFYRPK
jgi:peptidoglycan/xylan/chitin deacetylase (PgdA/CDA1 family)